MAGNTSAKATTKKAKQLPTAKATPNPMPRTTPTYVSALRPKIEPNEIFHDDDLIALIPNLHVRKLRDWLRGIHRVGEKVETIVPLRSFWLGDVRAYLGAWVLEFLQANSKLKNEQDDAKKVGSESEGGPQG